jgi:hypothetical protein
MTCSIRLSRLTGTHAKVGARRDKWRKLPGESLPYELDSCPARDRPFMLTGTRTRDYDLPFRCTMDGVWPMSMVSSLYGVMHRRMHRRNGSRCAGRPVGVAGSVVGFGRIQILKMRRQDVGPRHHVHAEPWGLASVRVLFVFVVCNILGCCLCTRSQPCTPRTRDPHSFFTNWLIYISVRAASGENMKRIR